jgi:TonB family protein
VKFHSCLKILFFIILPAASCLGQPNNSKQPAVISAASPVFPPIAAAANAVGEAIVDVDVNAAGRVSETVIVRVHPLLREAVDRAARKWQFERAPGGGGRRVARLTFIFRLAPSGTPASELTPTFLPPYTIELRHEMPVANADPAPVRARPSSRRSRARSKL